ncbi:hypothetical protein TNCV_3988131 [Trichonephila clavipes]|nr:hypothetical protein TNCV_3988131 [Trichonephila clavipes]
MFAPVHRNLCERSSLRGNMSDTRKRQLTRTFNVKEQLLQFIGDISITSTQTIDQQLKATILDSIPATKSATWRYYPRYQISSKKNYIRDIDDELHSDTDTDISSSYSSDDSCSELSSDEDLSSARIFTEVDVKNPPVPCH